MDRRKDGFWNKKTCIDVEASAAEKGFYEVCVKTARPCYAELHLFFASQDRGPAIIQLEPVTGTEFQAVFHIDAPCRRAEMVISPPVELTDVRTCEIRRLRMTTSARLGFKKVVWNLHRPRLILRKLRHVQSGIGSFAIDRGRRSHWDRSDAYAYWRQAFESERERDRILSALAALGPEHSRHVLFVYATGTRMPDALSDFLDEFEEFDGGPYSVELLVIENADSPLQPELLQRAKRFGATVFEQPGPGIPAKSVAEQATSCNAACVIFLESRGKFHEFAVPAFLLTFAIDGEALAAYADSDGLAANGQRALPRFNPCWSFEYFLSCDYVGAPVAFRNDPRVLQTDQAQIRPAIPSYALLLSLAERIGNGAICHIPRVLFHERTDGPYRKKETAENSVVAEVLDSGSPEVAVQAATTPEGVPMRIVRYPTAGSPLTSIIMPTKDNARLLRDAAQSVLGSDYPNLELLILDNGSQTKEQRRLLVELDRDDRVHVHSLPMPFNYSKLMNIGTRRSAGEIIVHLNDDTKALTDDWLEELVSLAAQSDVGCVGPLLLYRNHTVQHAGVILGAFGLAGHAFRFADPNAQGSDARLHMRHEVSAVTGACMAVRKSVYQEIGGFREDLAVDFNDIDFCLRVRDEGYRNLYTPFAKLFHFESSTRGTNPSKAALQRLASEQATFFATWGTGVLDDPYHSPNLSKVSLDYRLRFEA